MQNSGHAGRRMLQHSIVVGIIIWCAGGGDTRGESHRFIWGEFTDEVKDGDDSAFQVLIEMNSKGCRDRKPACGGNDARE
jgi:hypothetical protein